MTDYKNKPRLGQRKFATNERFKNQKDRNQYCIDGVLVKEVLDYIPKDLTIIGARIRVGTPFKRQKSVVPNKLRKYGCTYMVHSLPTTEAEITVDQVSATTIKRAIREVCKGINADPGKATFRYLTLSNGTATGQFTRTTKEMRPDERDLRKKANVLGLKEAQGKISTLIADLGVKNYHCSWEEITTRVVTCHL